MRHKATIITRLVFDLISRDKSSPNGENDSFKVGLQALKTNQEKGVPLFFPPKIVVEVKALACQLPKEFNMPISRFTHDQLAHLVCERGIVASISGTTIWRWLNEDAIKPWQYRSWIFPRDPDFRSKAGRVLDLYHRQWEGEPLDENDYVISADEKTSIQARRRIHETLPPLPKSAMRVEFEYERKGALAYLAAWDVNRAKVFGRCDTTTGILPFSKLVELVMSQQPYATANRVFWIIDNGSSHRGNASIKRLQEEWKNIVPVHLPIHVSWLNQIEIYFSIVQRKVLTPNNFSSLDELQNKLMDFQKIYEINAKPFQWKFTKTKLHDMLDKLASYRNDPTESYQIKKCA